MEVFHAENSTIRRMRLRNTIPNSGTSNPKTSDRVECHLHNLHTSMDLYTYVQIWNIAHIQHTHTHAVKLKKIEYDKKGKEDRV